MNKKTVEVAVGVILKGKQVFISKRHKNQHQGGLWEFPGGKIEANESVFTALKRELQEEVNISINRSDELMVIEHNYDDKRVRLIVHTVSDFSGIAKGLEGQQCQWIALEQLHTLAFPAANAKIITHLQANLLAQ